MSLAKTKDFNNKMREKLCDNAQANSTHYSRAFSARWPPPARRARIFQKIARTLAAPHDATRRNDGLGKLAWRVFWREQPRVISHLHHAHFRSQLVTVFLDYQAQSFNYVHQRLEIRLAKDYNVIFFYPIFYCVLSFET